MALLVLPMLLGVSAPPPASGDQLSDAIAQQKSLAAKIAAQKRQVAQLNAMQADLRSRIADTNQTLLGVNASLASVRAKITSLGTEIAQVKATYQDLVAQLADLDLQLSAIEDQQNKTTTELIARKGILANRIRAAYSSGRTSLLETLLSADSFQSVLSDVGYLMDIGAQDQALAQNIVTDQETIATLQATVTDTRAQTDELRIETAQQRAALAARISDMKAAQARFSALQAETARQLAIQQGNFAKIAKNKSAVAKLLAEELAAQNALKKKIAAIIRAQLAKGNIPSQYNGTLEWPMSGTITQEFGCTGFGMEPPLGGCAHFHQGIDIAAPMYTPVLAAGDGRVVFAGPNPYDPYPKAWIVIIAHSANLQTWYAHLDNGSHSIPVHAGQFVAKGDIIGYEGMTGHTNGPHLHWAVEYNDTFVNPRLFV